MTIDTKRIARSLTIIACLWLAVCVGAMIGAWVMWSYAPKYVIISPTAVPTSQSSEYRIVANETIIKRLPQAAVCFAEPYGNALGAIDAGSRFVEEKVWQGYNSEYWVLIQAYSVDGFDGNGGCWVRSRELARP